MWYRSGVSSSSSGGGRNGPSPSGIVARRSMTGGLESSSELARPAHAVGSGRDPRRPRAGARSLPPRRPPPASPRSAAAGSGRRRRAGRTRPRQPRAALAAPARSRPPRLARASHRLRQAGGRRREVRAVRPAGEPGSVRRSASRCVQSPPRP
jgi:hypothetical protein